MSQQLPSWHQSNLQQWQQFIQQKNVPHAILLHGHHGLGKAQLVKKMLQQLWCEQDGCETCRHCRWLQQDCHPDCTWLKPEALGKAIKIDAIREVCDWLQLSPLQTQQKVLVIQAAENLNLAASNALLKTLEEPPESCVIILISELPQRLLPTVLSRCYKMALHMPDQAFIQAWLKEKINFSPQDFFPEDLGPYALLQEFSEEQSKIRHTLFTVFDEVLQRKTYFLFAAEKLKDFTPHDILRYAYYFMRQQMKLDGSKLTHWLAFEATWLQLKRMTLQGANLNWSLQLELLLQKI